MDSTNRQLSNTGEYKVLRLSLAKGCLNNRTQGKVGNHLNKDFGISMLLRSFQQHLKEFYLSTKSKGVSHNNKVQVDFE